MTVNCHWIRNFSDSVPYGSTFVSMPGAECEYEGEAEVDDKCSEDCPGYKEALPFDDPPEPDLDDTPFGLRLGGYND